MVVVVITYAWPIHPLARLLPAKGNTGEVFVSARGELPESLTEHDISYMG